SFTNRSSWAVLFGLKTICLPSGYQTGHRDTSNVNREGVPLFRSISQMLYPPSGLSMLVAKTFASGESAGFMYVRGPGNATEPRSFPARSRQANCSPAPPPGEEYARMPLSDTEKPAWVADMP